MILVPPTDGELLLLYIAATTQVVSAALVVEREEEGHALKVQHPMYFISEVLFDSKTHYVQIQKLLYAVLITTRKLRHYFESLPVMIVMSFPLSEGIKNQDATGRIVKWALELMGQGISYAPRTAIKSLCWLISLQSGPRSKCREQSSTKSIGRCTSMDH